MKILLNKYILFFIAIFMIGSCGDDDFVENSTGGIQKIADPFLQILTPVVSFQAGTPNYPIAFNVVNGERAVTKINVFSTYTDANSGMSTERILFKSYTVGADNLLEVRDTIDYNQLREGITIDGAGLPDDQVLLPVGSGWVLSFEGETAQGDLTLGGKMNVAVLSRFAGLYRVIESDYYRINVQSGIADWRGQERFIGSVDATTFSYNDFWGPFGWSGSSFNFILDESDNSIMAPVIAGSGLFSGNRALDCNTEPGLFVDVPCDGSNMLIPDEVDGKHVIRLTYGYFSDGSGSRQFYEVLEKI